MSTAKTIAARTEPPLSVWLLSDGAPGHLSQSRGIVDALATRREVKLTTIDIKLRSKVWKRLGRLCLPRIRDTAGWLARTYTLSLPAGRPALIVSSGANTLLANALLARQHAVPNVYSGTLKGYDPAAFDCVFTVVALGVACNHVLPLPPVPGELAHPLPAAGGEPLIAVLLFPRDRSKLRAPRFEQWISLGIDSTAFLCADDMRLDPLTGDTTDVRELLGVDKGNEPMKSVGLALVRGRRKHQEIWRSLG